MAGGFINWVSKCYASAACSEFFRTSFRYKLQNFSQALTPALPKPLFHRTRPSLPHPKAIILTSQWESLFLQTPYRGGASPTL